MKVAVYNSPEKQEFLYNGELLAWGIDHDFNTGGTYSVGIIKRSDGSIKMIYPECLKILNDEEDSE